MTYELHHGDCLDVLPTLAAGSVDAAIADIPSGRTQCAWDSVIPLEDMWRELRRVIKPRGAIVLLGLTQPFTSVLVCSNPKMFRYEWVWDKVNRPTGHLNSSHRPLHITESICVFSLSRSIYNPQMQEGKPYRAISSGKKSGNYGAQKDKIITINEGLYHPRNLLSIPADERGRAGRLHPTQKPQPLLEYLVKTYTNEGDTVLDFCAGSGTCGAACGNLNRRFIGIERDETYFNIASERIAAAYAPLAAMERAS